MDLKVKSAEKDIFTVPQSQPTANFGLVFIPILRRWMVNLSFATQ